VGGIGDLNQLASNARTEARRHRLRRRLKTIGPPSILVTHPINVTYLTGFTGEDSYLLVTQTGEMMLSDGRFATQLEEQCPDLDAALRAPATAMREHVVRVVKEARIRELAIEADHMTWSLARYLEQQLSRVPLVPTSGIVEAQRMVKDRDEICAIRRAIWIAEKSMAAVRCGLCAEQTEREVVGALEQQMRRFGGTGCSFSPIVAVGARAALPHAPPTTRRIGDGDFVLIDWGAREELYVSDLTRLVVTGKISPKLERVYGVVLRAQQRAIDAIRPGARLAAVDAAARSVIARAGFGNRFRHGLGHGIGLEVHEAPRLAANQEHMLKAGMVVTVEPGIYLPGWGGVRIEDDVLVTRDGHELLSSAPKELGDCVIS
jgi:Xaa-Pro aminopeptidase